MTRKQSIGIVVDFLSAKLATSPVPEQAKVYEALGNILPTKRARAHAKQTAWVLREAEKLQIEFTSQLFSDLRLTTSGNGNGGHSK